ncbi:MAG: hypothetical protein WC586_06365 [Methanoregula sp.]
MMNKQSHKPHFSLAEQYEIVSCVGLLYERADVLGLEVAVAGRRCERLTQAVLWKAFAGRYETEDLMD